MGLKVRVSETARKIAAEKFGHIVGDPAETCAAWLTLLEEVDARYADKLEPPAETHTAMIASLMFDPRRREDFKREWQAAREPIVRGFADFLSLFPRPFMISMADVPSLQIGPGGVNVFHENSDGEWERGWRPTSPPAGDR